MPRIPRVALVAGGAAAAALAAIGGVAILVGAPSASGDAARVPTAVTVMQGDGTKAPAVDAAAAKVVEVQLSEIVPGYRFVADDSFHYSDEGGADYTRLSGTAPGLGGIGVSVYRHFDAAELRAAKLVQTSDPALGTFWVGALDRDLTSVYFQPLSGPPIWLGEHASSRDGPAPALDDVKALAVKIAGLPAVQALAGEKH
jgi:hypothetical protein